METLLKKFSIPSDVDVVDGYAYLIAKKQLAHTLSKMTDSEVTVPMKDSASKAQEIIAAIRNHKESYPGYKDYKKLYDKVDGILKKTSKVIGKSIDSSEIILKVFEDYSGNIEVLNSVENSVDSDSLTGIAIRELKEEYSNKYLTCFNELVEYVYSETVEAGIKEAEKEFAKKLVKEFVSKKASKSAGGLLTIVETAIDSVGDLTGLAPKSQAQLELSIVSSQTSDLADAYSKCFNTVQNGDTSDAAILALKNSFELLKRNMVREYELAADIVNAEGKYNMKVYYQYCRQEVLGADINSLELPQLMSYEQYVKYEM